MLYLSELINSPIYDRQGAVMARVQDLVVRLASAPGDDGPPRLHGLVARLPQGGAGFFVPVAQVGRVAAGHLALQVPQVALEQFARRPGELLLARDVWDHRVIDCQTRRVRRVNDVAVGPPAALNAPTPADGYAAADLVLLGADIGLGGILRRLGLYRPLFGLLGERVASALLPWARMELFAGSTPGTAHHGQLGHMHPVEIAHLTENISHQEAAEMLATLDDALAADVLEEMPAERQMDIVEYLPDDRTAGILDEMAPDDATDLLGDLLDARAHALLAQMDPTTVEAVRLLLHYPDNTAGGMMTTSYVRVDAGMTVAETLECLRGEVAKPDMIYYVYVTPAPDDLHLLGVVSLRELLLAAPDARVESFMRHEYLAVGPDEEDREVARRLAEYNLMALPVLDNRGFLLGIITVDDALDVLLPPGWQRRLPRIFR